MILFAEDNPDDAFIFQAMFKRFGGTGTVHHVDNGQEVINWLIGKGNYSDRTRFPMPGLLLLDLKMPLKTGFEVLEWLRAQSQFQELPVIILSSSDDKTDLKRAQELGVTAYFVKSPQFDDVIQYLRRS